MRGKKQKEVTKIAMINWSYESCDVPETTKSPVYAKIYF